MTEKTRDGIAPACVFTERISVLLSGTDVRDVAFELSGPGWVWWQMASIGAPAVGLLIMLVRTLAKRKSTTQ